MPDRFHPSPLSLASCAILAAAMLVASPAPAGAKHRQPTLAESTATPGSQSAPATPGSQPELSTPGSQSAHLMPRLSAQQNGNCQLSLEASPNMVTAGESVILVGQLVCPAWMSAQGETITIYQHEAGVPGAAVLGQAIAGERGIYRLTSAPLGANSVFIARSTLAHRGARAVVKVAARISLSGPAQSGQQLATLSAPRAGGARDRYTFTGSVQSASAGTLVAFQRQSAAEEQWRTVKFGRVSDEGRFSFSASFRSPGEVSVRVVVRPAGEVAAASEPLTHEIAQAQNPRLTIQTSADPVSPGESTTLTGTAVGAANQAVTLLADAGGPEFAPVAKTTAKEAGAYSFTVAPAQSTFYRVARKRMSSTPVLVGVKDLLAVSPTPGAVEAGSTVTFTGSLAPDAAGQMVDLEGENPGGVGFHLIAAAPVNAAPTSTRSHTRFTLPAAR